MAFNSISVLNPAIWQPTVQDYLNNMLIAKEVANTKYAADLKFGDTINFPQTSDVRVQTYTPGTDLAPTAIVGTQSQLLVNQSKAAVVTVDLTEEKQALADYPIALARQSAYQLANNIDQQLINAGIVAANQTLSTTGTLTVSSIYQLMVDAQTALFRKNATDGELFAIMPPAQRGLLTQTFVSNGFNYADSTLENGFQGKANGFSVYVSNNLPSAVNLTLAVNPTANDTMTLFGITWTFVANGTAATAGQISIGAAASNTQTSILQAVTGTGSPGASNYIDVSADNRTLLTNLQASVGTWTANVAAVTAYGYIGAASVFTSASNFFGTETTSILFGRKGALSLGMQLEPNLYTADVPLQIAKYYKTHTLFGVKVFTRDAFRLVKANINA